MIVVDASVLVSRRKCTPTRKFARSVSEYTRPWQEKKKEKTETMGIREEVCPV
jgi:hypothetical protein